MHDIRLVGFDGDDTLWRSEDYYRAAEKRYEEIIGRYIDLHDAGTLRHLLEVERRNLKVFGYGVKGMTLSMIEAAIELTEARISARDLQQVVDIGRDTLAHPVELLDGIRDAVEAVAARWQVVLVTKGDLFHQEDKIARSGLADLFPRIEIVSEKDPPTYARVLAEFGIAPEQFVMVGNSLRLQAFMHWARADDDPGQKARWYPRVDKDALVPEYIADSSGHSRGATVDLTLVRCDGDGRCEPLDMGTPFDFFDPSAHTDAPVAPAQQANRQRLRAAMEAGGFRNYPREWWHYTLDPEPDPTLAYDVPVR